MWVKRNTMLALAIEDIGESNCHRNTLRCSTAQDQGGFDLEKFARYFFCEGRLRNCPCLYLRAIGNQYICGSVFASQERVNFIIDTFCHHTSKCTKLTC